MRKAQFSSFLGTVNDEKTIKYFYLLPKSSLKTLSNAIFTVNFVRCWSEKLRMFQDLVHRLIKTHLDGVKCFFLLLAIYQNLSKSKLRNLRHFWKLVKLRPKIKLKLKRMSVKDF